MREYKIYKTDLWYGIYRRRYIGKMLAVQYLNSHNLRAANKDTARVFYTEESATSALIVQKIKDGKDRQNAG